MAHYAFLDENNIVTEVIPGKNEGEEGIDWEQFYGQIKGQVCKRTSYNTLENRRIDGGVPFRGNYAGIGHKYLPEYDIFVRWPKPYPSWILDLDRCKWTAPISKPTDDDYEWDEENQKWIFIRKTTF